MNSKIRVDYNDSFIKNHFYHKIKKNSDNNYYVITKNILQNYSLPTNLNDDKIKKNKQIIQSNIYKNIFLDKKKINQFPRYIKLIKIGKARIMEIKDFDRLNETIFRIVS